MNPYLCWQNTIDASFCPLDSCNSKWFATGHNVGRITPTFIALIVIAMFGVSVRAGELQAEMIVGWEFQRSDDRNSDQWPDQWRRRSDRFHPGYIPVKITLRDVVNARELATAQLTLSRWWLACQSGEWNSARNIESIPKAVADFFDRWVLDNCLEVRMDGGAVELESPVVKLEPQYSYYLDAKIATSSLDGHRVSIELELLNGEQHNIRTLSAPFLTGTNAWTHVSTPSNDADAAKVRFGKVLLKIKPLESIQLSGTVKLDSVRIFRTPKLMLTTNAAHNVTQLGKPITVSCQALGIRNPNSAVNFQLFDHLGMVLKEESIPLNLLDRLPATLDRATPLAHSSSKQGRFYVNSKSEITPANVRPEDAGKIDGVATWTLNLADPGFYKVRVDLGGSSYRFHQREIGIGVVDGILNEGTGPFGWSVPEFGPTVSIEQIPKLVELAGAGWIKFPVWFDAADSERADRLAWLVERLQSMKVNCVGRLELPHDSVKGAATLNSSLAINQFQSADVWEPLLEPVLTRMSMKVSWFQLGGDQDRSFLGRSDLGTLLHDVRTRMQAYSQEELKLAIPWIWLDPFPGGQPPSWQGSQLAVQPQLTAAELASYLASQGPTGHSRWVALDPLPNDRYSLLDRTRDLTERMVVVKKFGAQAAFVTEPFDSRRGIFNSDGSIGELLIPWRSLVSNIGAATYVGSMDMPNGSLNHVFQRDNDGLMLLWNDKPTTEQLYLGEKLKGLDLWGRTVSLKQQSTDQAQHESTIDVGPWPMIIKGINVQVVQFRQAFELRTRNIDSLVGQQQSLECYVRNTFKQSIQGTVTTTAPTLLQNGVSKKQIQLSTDSGNELSIPILLRSDASAGTHPIRFDFDLQADRRYQFSVYRSLTLGSGNIEMQWTAQREGGQRGLLRLELDNNSEQPVSFDCKLFPPGLPYQRFQIMGANPGRTSREFFLNLQDVKSDSTLLLCCEQIGTVRVLNYRIPLSE